ncbi:MAG TPA: glycine cleavage system aminomethyltransferase GcvT, partial [Clostridia bacterium]|nr:glycine cleavage system aminomethyltransferase GcvT [Clostridia bacterium]
MKRTPLFAAHQLAGAKLIEFGGWEMPVYYTSIASEHLAVRNAAGLFDIAHMGEIAVSGPEALAYLNYVLANDAARLTEGQGQYTFLCNAAGGVIDDLYLYCLGTEHYLLIVNASRIDADYSWLQSRLAEWKSPGRVTLENQSDRLGAVALQGPKAAVVAEQCFPGASQGGVRVSSVSGLKKNELGIFELDGRRVYVARTGYTGEDGFEMVAEGETLQGMWDRLLKAGVTQGLKPAGLGARDTLRTEVCYPLYGHELDEQTTPIEAGLGFFVALNKGDFVGRSTLAEQKANGANPKLVAFKMAGHSAPPRAQYPIWISGETSQAIGVVTSGTQSPSLGIGIGMGYVPAAFARPETP